MIGIAGGMGPLAGVDFFKKILENTIAEKDQEHLGVILISTPQIIDDRTDFLIGKTKRNPGLAIAKILLQLESNGATLAAIPCNTAHAGQIFSVITSELLKANSKIQLLNMIDETVEFVSQNIPATSAIGVLSTTGTYKYKLYSKPLLDKGYRIIEPTLEMQESLIHPAVYDLEYGIKSQSNPIHPKAMHNLSEGIRYLKAEGAETLILGCTEIPLAITEPEVFGMPVIQPTTILARKLIAIEAPEKLKPI